MRLRLLFVSFTATAFCAATTAIAAQDAPQVTVVMSGLDNPRGLAFGPERGLYVAEAGRGPSAASCFTSPDQFTTKTPEGEIVFGCGCSRPNTSVKDCTQPTDIILCSGPTGAVSRLWRGRQERLVTGLPSWATSSGRAEGPNDVALLGRGEAFVTIGLEASPRLIADMRSVLGSAFGRLLQFSGLSGEWRFVAAYEEAHPTRDPSNGTPDSNPFGLLVDPGERVVVDASGKALLRVAANGHISTLAVLPWLPRCLPPPAPQSLCVEEGAVHDGDPVPTRIALGPDGAYYVGILTGTPFPDGADNIYRIVPGEAPAVACTGFKAMIGLAFDAQSNLYVLEHASPTPPSCPGLTGLTCNGALYRIDSGLLDSGCDRKHATPVISADTKLLLRPTAVIVGPDGALYVSNHRTSLGTDPLLPGQVLRIVPPKQ